jgi:hypothetical protein
MRRIALVLAGVLMMVGLTACGSSSNTNASSNDTGTSASTMNTAAPTDCPTTNDKAFAKTRFVANVGIIVGTFHHWIYKPYKAGTFQKGAKGRTFALIKAGLAAAFIANRTSAAVKDAKASPLLCKTIGGPLSAAADKLGSLKDAIKSGNFSDLTSLNGLFGTVTSGLAAAGLPIKETTGKL